ncbi:MAG: peptidylprolyl isomerase [Gemmatimonadales bacterium]
MTPETPKTVANFEKLANETTTVPGSYDSRFRHPGRRSALQKDPNNPAVGTGAGYQIKCETHLNTHKHVAGTLSMAHAGKDTGGSPSSLLTIRPSRISTGSTPSSAR